MAGRIPAAGEGMEHGSGGSVVVKNKRRDSANMHMRTSLLEVVALMMSQQNAISISTGGGLELTEVVVTGFQVSENSSTVPQGSNGDEVGITIDIQTEQQQGVNDDEINNMNQTNETANMSNNVSPKLLSRSLLTVSMLTLSMVMATAFYKAPTGVVFGHHRLVYYLTLTGIFVVGIVEALTAIWISCSDDANKRRFSFGKVVLCVSIVPSVTILAIGGFAFIIG